MAHKGIYNKSVPSLYEAGILRVVCGQANLQVDELKCTGGAI